MGAPCWLAATFALARALGTGGTLQVAATDIAATLARLLLLELDEGPELDEPRDAIGLENGAELFEEADPTEAAE